MDTTFGFKLATSANRFRIPFMTPEWLHNLSSLDDNVDKINFKNKYKSDIFSLGLTLLEM